MENTEYEEAKTDHTLQGEKCYTEKWYKATGNYKGREVMVARNEK